ncbi:MAG: hypothetical protein R3E60_07400 [Alphaproteobacteria bacterium]
MVGFRTVPIVVGGFILGILGYGVTGTAARAQDWSDIPCGDTPFHMADSAYKCRISKRSGGGLGGGPSGQADFILLYGVKDRIERVVVLCVAGMRTYCTNASVDDIKTMITNQRSAPWTPRNWGAVRKEKGDTYIPFDVGGQSTCLAFVHYDQAADNGYRFYSIGHACTNKNRSDADTALITAAREFTNFKK